MSQTSKARPEWTDWVLSAQTDPDAARQYRAAVAHLFEVELLGPESEFHNRLQGVNLAGSMFGRCQGVAQRFHRSTPLIRGDGIDHIQLVIYLTGDWHGEYDGRPASGGAGSMRFLEMDRAFSTTTGDYDMLNLMLPRTALAEGQVKRDLHGLTLTEDIPSVRVLIGYLRALWDTVEGLSADEASAAIQAAALLIGGVIRAHAPVAEREGNALDRTLVARVRDYIDRHIGRETLTPAAIAEHLKINRTALYRTFKLYGGVQAFIQDRRLERTFDLLTGPDGGGKSLSDIAYAHGFRSDAHFNRAFRARYKIPPGRLRGMTLSRADQELGAKEGRAPVVMNWVRTL